MRQARVRSTGAGAAAALLLALAWLVAPIEACLAAATGVQATAPACAGCEGGMERAALSLDGGCEPAGCTMRAPAPCRDATQVLPPGGQAQPVAAVAAGLRLPVTDPHGAPVPPEPPPPDAEPQYLLCCSFLI